MITINRADLIGKGAHRECYKHPENKSLCIKITFDSNKYSIEIKNEKKYYSHLEKRGIPLDMIPKYYGDVETNLGLGSVYDLILDQDETISKSLEFYLSSNEETEKYYDSLYHSLCLLKEYLLKNRIVTMEIKPYNVLCQKTETGLSRLFIIDNVYNSEFIPISTYFSYFAKRKILRKWQRFENRILDTHKNNKALYRMLTSSSFR
ncbi:MAG: hypothetical protein JW976_12545 [Syntrophaceae bacterium]|nr:hypothetical protein [Syntrophaceae bacterium]